MPSFGFIFADVKSLIEHSEVSTLIVLLAKVHVRTIRFVIKTKNVIT